MLTRVVAADKVLLGGEIGVGEDPKILVVISLLPPSEVARPRPKDILNTPGLVVNLSSGASRGASSGSRDAASLPILAFVCRS